MKTSEYKAKPPPHASRAQGPFFHPNRQATFFSDGSVQREPFFNPSRVVPAIQAKLTVGAVGDRYEQEADHVAANVVAQINDSSAQVSGEQASVQRMGEKEENMQMKPIAEKIQRMGMEEEENLQMKPMFETVQRMGEEEEDLQMKSAAEKIQRMGMEEEEDLQMKPTLQRIGHEGGAVSTDLEAEIQSARGSGQALAPDLQAQMGQAMGADFSGVRVHTNAQSDRLNQSIQAKAFTTGQDMFFRQGTYEPGSRGGQELIAHELTHVVQQNGGNVISNKISEGNSAGKLQRKVKIKGVKRGKQLKDNDKLPAIPEQVSAQYRMDLANKVKEKAREWVQDKETTNRDFASADAFYQAIYQYVITQGTTGGGKIKAPWPHLKFQAERTGAVTEVPWSDFNVEAAAELEKELEECTVQKSSNPSTTAFHGNAHGKLPKVVAEGFSDLEQWEQADVTKSPYVEFLITGHKRETGIERGLLDTVSGLIYLTAHYDQGSMIWLSGAPANLIANWRAKASTYRQACLSVQPSSESDET